MTPTTKSENQQEIEWQFDVDDLGAVESWLHKRAEAGDLQFHFGEPKAHVDSYYDTPDWRLFRAGYVLRVRQAEGEPAEATLKSFGTRKDGLRQRREINERLNFNGIASDSIHSVIRAPGPVGQRLKAVLGKRAAHPLRRLFDAHTRRQRIGVYRDGARLAEIALDDVSIAADWRRKPVHFRRVEVEVSPDGASGRVPDAAEAFVAEMRSAHRLQPAADSKFELGLRAQRLQPGFVLDLGTPEDTDHLDDDPAIGELACAVLREHFAQFLAQEPGVRLGEDAEAVHRARVATRRLRAAMSLFRDYLPPEAQRLRDELRWIAQLLGGVRDLDVQLERLAAWRAEDAMLEPHALDSLESLLAGQRERAQAKLLHGLNSARYERLVADFAGFLRGACPDAGAQCAKPARKEMPGLIRRRYDKVRALGDDLESDSPPSEYHALRIRCKRLRYALEFAEPLYRKAIRNYLPRLVALQDLLGLHQDAYVAMAEMRRLSLASQHGLPAQTIFALGEISQRYAQQAEALRAEFPKVYRRIKGKAWEKLQRALE